MSTLLLRTYRYGLNNTKNGLENQFKELSKKVAISGEFLNISMRQKILAVIASTILYPV
jgi:hypothetical protein